MMNLKRTLTSFAAFAAAALAAASVASAAPASASVLIRHETHGCHSWSVNGGTFKAIQKLTLSVKGTLTVTNNDVMPHKFVELSGPTARLQTLPTPMAMGLKGHFGAGMMAHMGAATKVTFPTAGTYVFTTKAGEDYMKGIKTTGEDNVLRLVVTVR
jgi:hypothetical protein